jgi:hypothetical protein
LLVAPELGREREVESKGYVEEQNEWTLKQEPAYSLHINRRRRGLESLNTSGRLKTVISLSTHCSDCSSDILLSVTTGGEKSFYSLTIFSFLTLVSFRLYLESERTKNKSINGKRPRPQVQRQ